MSTLDQLYQQVILDHYREKHGGGLRGPAQTPDRPTVADGALISGVRGPYEYLPASVHKFPAPQQMLARMRSLGFKDATWTPYTFGIAGLYRAKK